MKFSDETLMAYADGELDAQTREAIERAMATDPDIAQSVARHKALRERLRNGFASVLDERVPERLHAVARAVPNKTRPNNVTNLADRRRARQAHVVAAVDVPDKNSAWSWPQLGAMAATLMIGVLVGYLMLPQSPPQLLSERNGRLEAGGALDEALTHQLAAESTKAGNPVHVGLSFRTESGDYCRTFALSDTQLMAGLACRAGDAWNVEVLARGDSENAPPAAGSAATSAPATPGAAPVSEGYRMASSGLPQAVLQAVEKRRQGDALDAAGEARARESGWRSR